MLRALKMAVAAIVLTLSFVIIYSSCNKDDNVTATTIIKCVTCANGGSCINDTCRCPAGYEGSSCQTLSIQKFIEFTEWEVQEQGSSSPFSQYTIYMNRDGSSVSSVVITNLYQAYLSTGTQITADIVGDSIFIPLQSLDANNDVIVGKGILKPNTGGAPIITMRYMITNSTAGTTNDFGYSNPANSPSIWTAD